MTAIRAQGKGGSAYQFRWSCGASKAMSALPLPLLSYPPVLLRRADSSLEFQAGCALYGAILFTTVPYRHQRKPSQLAQACTRDEAMDPLTALGLAAGVVQFVSFASHLITKTKAVHDSSSGQTDEAATLETTYTRLHELSRNLEACSRRDPTLEIVEGNTDYVKNVLAIKDLSRSCDGDCQKLLKIVDKLKAGDNTHHRWQSFRVALRTVWKGNEIAELEQRLHHTQMTLTLLVCSQTRYVYSPRGDRLDESYIRILPASGMPRSTKLSNSYAETA